MRLFIAIFHRDNESVFVVSSSSIVELFLQMLLRGIVCVGITGRHQSIKRSIQRFYNQNALREQLYTYIHIYICICTYMHMYWRVAKWKQIYYTVRYIFCFKQFAFFCSSSTIRGENSHNATLLLLFTSRKKH